MRKLALLFIQIIFISSAYGQNTEYSLHLNSGFFSFGGSSTTSNTIMIERRFSNDAYTNNPFGRNYAVSYGLSGQIQRVTKGKFIIGFQSGFEAMRSSVNITDVADYSGNLIPASGNTVFKHSFINIYPNLGYRFNVQGLNLDLTIGPEVGVILNSKEIGDAQLSDGTTVKTNYDRHKPENDYRIRSSLTIHYKNWGFSTGYSYGLSNYMSGYVGGVNKATSRFIRLGIEYRIF
jgi:hypothetical protein